ncbi:MAG: hypothetical protein CMD39_07350 [Gammaproteobacteria bacterium]|nr:hypothetical protein [Gammaproteobacteria bacterium]
MSNVGVDAGCSPQVWDSHLQQLVNELWWASESPAGHGQYVLTDAQFNQCIGQPDVPSFVAALPPNGQVWYQSLDPDAQEGIFRSSQVQQPI